MVIISLLLAVFGGWGWSQIGLTMFAISLLFSFATFGETLWCKWNHSVSSSELHVLGCLIIVTNILNFAGVVAGVVITFCK